MDARRGGLLVLNIVETLFFALFWYWFGFEAAALFFVALCAMNGVRLWKRGDIW